MRIKGSVGAPGWEVNAREPLQLRSVGTGDCRADPRARAPAAGAADAAARRAGGDGRLLVQLPQAQAARRLRVRRASAQLQPGSLYNLTITTLISTITTGFALQPCNGGGLTLGGADCAGLAPRRYEFQCQYGSIGWRCAAVGVSQPRWDICR